VAETGVVNKNRGLPELFAGFGEATQAMNTTPTELSHAVSLAGWSKDVAQHFGHMSKPITKVLAEFSFGMFIAQASGRAQVATSLAGLLRQRASTIEQRIYTWMVEAGKGSKAKGDNWQAKHFFAPLASWIVSLWCGKKMAIILDATSLSDSLVVLSISIAYRQMCFPVAWKILPSGKPGKWNPHWMAMLDEIAPSIPKDMQVLVLSDRGIYSKLLYLHILGHAWHPFMRVNGRGRFMATSKRFRGRVNHIKDLQPLLSECGRLEGVAFSTKKAQLHCNLLCTYDEKYADPWFILTDLKSVDPCLYGMRSWCEPGFKCIKSAQFGWQRTQVTEPLRAERCWIAIALALLLSILTSEALLADPVFGPCLRDLCDGPNPTIRISKVVGHVLPALAVALLPHILARLAQPGWLSPSQLRLRKNLPP
jgi:hypothetical protein